MYNVCQKFFNEINKQEVVRNQNRYKRGKFPAFYLGTVKVTNIGFVYSN